MKGDFTRLTFQPPRHYSGVRWQQGRVQLDADWNEQVDIREHLERTTTQDVVGRCGAPWHPPGEFRHFQLRAAGRDFEIAPGRFYAGGLLCENEAAVRGSAQPHLPAAAVVRRADGSRGPLPAPAGTYVAYLDVWERHVTALEDPALREPALGGPDTATRTQVVWQVELLAVADGATCSQFGEGWEPPGAKTLGQLSARAAPAQESANKCLVLPGGGFRRLENQLYRVEIHGGGPLGGATFKWSRDNGTVVAGWLERDGNNLKVGSAGRDGVLGFAAGQWVELTDDTRDFLGQPGTLAQLDAVDGTLLTIKPTADPVDLAQFPRNPKVRRWDSPGPVKVEVPAANDGWVALEDGVEVKFASGPYRSGDYWLIPARTLTAKVEWPAAGAVPLPQPPHGVRHHYCALALLRADANGNLTVLSDCRRLFPPATRLLSFFYVGGDGQEAPPGEPLAQPLRVGAANGSFPVAGVRVRFAAEANGRVAADRAGLATATAASIEVTTDAEGVAGCAWRLDPDVARVSQQLIATLLDSGGAAVHLPIRFAASHSLAGRVAYLPNERCPRLANVRTVQDAIDELCRQMLGTDPGIRVRKIGIGPDGQRTALANDSNVQVRLLAGGIQVDCDREVFLPSVRGKPTCYVTLDLPFPFNQVDRQLWTVAGASPVIGFQPLVLAADPVAEGNSIIWRPTAETARWLNERLLGMVRELQRGDRVLAHLTLKGNFIWSREEPRVYLDGEVYGVTRSGGLTDLDLARGSGDGRRGGDFEMWFWLVPNQ